MANFIRLWGPEPISRKQCDGVTNAHADGDICYEQGAYGIALDNVGAGGSLALQIDCVAYVPVPAGIGVGVKVFGPSQPAGPITLAASGAVALGITEGARDTFGKAEVRFIPALSLGN